MSDYVLLATYLVILGSIKTIDSFIAVVFFGLTVGYADFFMFNDSHFGNLFTPDLDHILISLILIPAIITSSKPVALSFGGYAVLQWLAAGEYLMSDTSEFIIGNFASVAIALNLLIMAALIYGRHNYINHKNSLMANSWIITLCHHYRQTSSGSQKREGQC